MRNRIWPQTSRVWGVVVFSLLLPFFANGTTEEMMNDKHNRVVMRMIGHELLNCLGDRESRVLPIEREEDQYRIAFEFEFGFDPDDMISVVDGVIAGANFPAHYFVEVLQCESEKMVYSFEISNTLNLGLLPCEGRYMPIDCYTLLITIMDPAVIAKPIIGWKPGMTQASVRENAGQQSKSPSLLSSKSTVLAVPVLLLIAFGLYYSRQKNSSEEDPNILLLGSSSFDRRTMTLTYQDQQVQFSNKEAELLTVLHATVNEPVERAEILHKVWGDEGDYVGRTLDVFISKLRKKLEPDSSLSIINIRGIGYKLVVE